MKAFVSVRMDAQQSRMSVLIAALKQWQSAFRTWRLERMAIDQLGSLNDRQLKDIGLHRSEIVGTVRNRETRGRRPSRYY